MKLDEQMTKTDNTTWDSLSHEEKNHQLFLRQKELLDRFLERGAISQAQYNKSLHDLTEKKKIRRDSDRQGQRQ